MFMFNIKTTDIKDALKKYTAEQRIDMLNYCANITKKHPRIVIAQLTAYICKQYSMSLENAKMIAAAYETYLL